MKPLIFLLVVLSAVTAATAQKKTILLVRHAEKVDESRDPELSAAGKERAERLVKAIGRFRPGAFYSTNYKRTRATLAPLAAKRKKRIETYDARQPQALIDEIMKSKTKRFVISGHSNTIPGLVNLITKKELFKNLEDSEFSVIWLIKLKDGKLRRLELLDY
ncbi:MAG: histidine phosphatase family protein [Pyrinomonadaceae bacterium]